MGKRVEYARVAAEGVRAFAAFSRYTENTGLEASLVELVKTRASQINGCAYCIDMHTKDARALGEEEQRLYALSAWRETPFFSERERAALEWTEAVTLLGDGPIDDELFDEVSAHFDEKELVDLTLAIIAINGWNRLAVPFRTEVGTYRSRFETR